MPQNNQLRNVRGCHVVLLSASLSLWTPHAAQAQERPIGRTPLCATADCHPGFIGRTVPHEPAQKRECLSCHDYDSPAEHTFTLVAQGADLCLECHESHESAVVHKPVQDGRCTECHDPHGSDHANLLHEESEDLCVRCHQQDFSKRKYVHGPVVVGACAICHASHSSSYEGLLVEPIVNLCVECHDDVKPPERTIGLTVHSPMGGGCTSCHDPHATDHPFQLQSEVRDVCFTCHDEMRSRIDSAAHRHGPVTEPDGCTQCHNPHFSPLPRLQREPQPDLCLTCHDREISLDDGSGLPDMKTLLDENPDHHGPIREGACTACHNPHAGDVFRVLLMEYPREFYAPFEQERYGLCFSCHLEDLVFEEQGRGLTGFRDGELNLHYLHVNRQKGRTCRACHEVHASKHEFHIRDTVPFGRGGWELPINYMKTDDGGSCMPGCHKPRAYSRTAAINSAASENGATQGGR